MKTPITYYSEKLGNDCYICKTYTYHCKYIIIATSYTSYDEQPGIEIYKPKELLLWALMYDSQLSKWIERMILENE